MNNTQEHTADTPRWNLSPIYESFSCDAYKNDVKKLHGAIERFDRLCAGGFSTPETLTGALELYENLASLYENLQSYAYARYSVNTSDAASLKELGKLEELDVPLSSAMTVFRNSLDEASASIGNWRKNTPYLEPYGFFLEEQQKLRRHQMSPELENLAADLGRSGGEAWSRLQQTVSSHLSGTWTNPATQETEEKTVIELRSLAFDPDRAVRKAAYGKELELWKQVEIPMAAALNGVKGTAVTLNARRNWETPIEKAVFQSRLSEKALQAMISSMEAALPRFRSYLKKKAEYLNIPSCGFFDVFAPVASKGESKLWTFEEAKEFICNNFSGFSAELGDFAAYAFEHNWIDAKPEKGKVGGAYCISYPLAKESRILSNFTGTYSDVGTLAHELGHAYHHHVLKDSRQTEREYPMTLAETASIFCETIAFNGAMASEGMDKLLLVESFLQDSTQVIVDILSRFYFEKAVFEKRKEGELSPADFCSLMTEAQRNTYGDGLDAELLHPYMWAVKGHYYSPSLGFYNFPYAFGLLFGLGLYETYKSEGSGFVKTYDSLLSHTGNRNAIALCREAGFDIETEAFWNRGLDAVGYWIDRFISGV